MGFSDYLFFGSTFISTVVSNDGEGLLELCFGLILDHGRFFYGFFDELSFSSDGGNEERVSVKDFEHKVHIFVFFNFYGRSLDLWESCNTDFGILRERESLCG
jgi:hypothetical protein